MKFAERINTNTAIVAVLTALISGLSIGSYSIKVSRELIEKNVKNNLVSIRESKIFEIEEYFNIIHGQIKTFSKDLMIIDAMRQFETTFDNLPVETFQKNRFQQSDTLIAFYANDYQDEYNRRNPGSKIEVEPLFSTLSERSRLFQYHFIAANQYPLGSKGLLNKSNNKIKYNAVHNRFHPHIREFAKTFGYYDIFLVSLERGDIVYSADKEIDYATSLVDGPYANTNIGLMFRLAKQSKDPDFVGLSDLAPYLPSYGELAGFIASPIVDQNKTIGILIFQMPVDQINTIMLSDKRWNKIGLGKTGATYLVGEDYKLRSQSRLLIDDRTLYLNTLRSAGESPHTVNAIEARNSSIGLHPVKSKTVKAAFSGDSGIDSIHDFRNVAVLSAYAPIDIEGLNWVILSEIDESEAFAIIDLLRESVLIFILTILILISISSAWICWFLSKELKMHRDDQNMSMSK